MGDEKSAIVACLRALSVEVRELTGETVPRVPALGVPEFLRDYVGPNLPVVIPAAGAHWPALERWTPDYLVAAAAGSLVTVALTPNGRADCPTPLPGGGGGGGEAFALPAQRRAPLAAFFEVLAASQADPAAPVPYLQFQNSSLTVELPQLLPDVDAALPWAAAAFGGPPDAVNLWIGGRGSITSWHRDHYENVYVMVRGRKAFRLLPPCDAHRMRLRRYPQATWALDSSESAKNGAPPLSLPEEVRRGAFRLAPDADGAAVLWSSVPPAPLGSEAAARGVEDGGYLGDGLPPPLVVVLGPGEALYLPACWWHEVHHLDGEQEPAIAVNYWHDMKFDGRYAAAKAFEAVAAVAGLNEPEAVGEASGDDSQEPE